MTLGRLLPLLILLSGSVGCGDDVAPPEIRRATVLVSDRDTGDPVADIRVVAVDGPRNLPLAGPLATAADGRVRFDLEPTDGLRFIVVGALGWAVHSQQDWGTERLTGNADESRILLRRSQPQDGLPRIRGRVVDADTGEPVPLAWLGVWPYPIAHSGFLDPGTDASAPDGSFTVREIAFAAHPITGNLTQLEALVVTAAGYQARTWVHEPAPGDNNLDIEGVVIALEREDPADTGVLTGRVLQFGAPAAGVLVGLGGVGPLPPQPDKSGFGLPGRTALTDSEGRYRFADLATGGYVVQPGFLMHDTVALAPGAPARVEVVSAAQTTEVADLAILPEIRPLVPDDQVVVAGRDDLVLAWTTTPQMAQFVLKVDGKVLAQVLAPAFAGPVPDSLSPGWHYWEVEGINGNNELAGVMQRPAWFRLAE